MKNIMITTVMAVFLMAGGMARAQNTRTTETNQHHATSSMMQKDTLRSSKHRMMQPGTKMMQHHQINKTQEGMMQNHQKMQAMMNDHGQMCMNMMKMHQQDGNHENMMTGQTMDSTMQSMMMQKNQKMQAMMNDHRQMYMNMMKMHQQDGNHENMMTGQTMDSTMQSMMMQNMQKCRQMMSMHGNNAGIMHNPDSATKQPVHKMNHENRMLQMKQDKVNSGNNDEASRILNITKLTAVNEAPLLRLEPRQGKILSEITYNLLHVSQGLSSRER